MREDYLKGVFEVLDQQRRRAFQEETHFMRCSDGLSIEIVDHSEFDAFRDGCPCKEGTSIRAWSVVETRTPEDNLHTIRSSFWSWGVVLYHLVVVLKIYVFVAIADTIRSATLTVMKKDKTTNKETSMGTAIDMGRNSKKRKIVNEGVGAEVDAEGGGPLNVNKNEIRDGVEKPASLKVEADTEGWTKVGKKSKKSKKEKKKIESQIPRFMYSNGDIVKRQHAVGVEEIRDLAIHLLLHEGRPPSFIRIEHTERIAKVVILLVPGITPDVLNINIEAGTLKNPNLPMTIPFAAGFIPNTFSHACPTRAPGDQSRMFSVLGTFLNVRMIQNGDPVLSYPECGSKSGVGRSRDW
ncbi:hypothetical protein FB446DRAFT_774706 [Lentinula raphanica]|nr:hypothetical protein FB446DRAFT_774706 [Lentinula raphanica]